MSACGLGDEEWVNLVPAQQFLSRYVFFADPTCATTNLVVVRTRGPSGFADVHVACLGTIDGWRPVGSGKTYEYAHVDSPGPCRLRPELAIATGRHRRPPALPRQLREIVEAPGWHATRARAASCCPPPQRRVPLAGPLLPLTPRMRNGQRAATATSDTGPSKRSSTRS
jgi:hypothetical protein